MTDSDDEYWMEQALMRAREAGAADEVPVGAVLVRAGQILGAGANASVKACDASAHAEILALREAGRSLNNHRLPGTTLFVTVEPCTMCFGALMHARVARVVYGAQEPRAGVCGSALRLQDESFYNHRIAVTGGVLAGPAARLLRDFFVRRR